MVVGWNLVDRQRDRFGAADFCQSETASLMDGNTTAQVGQRKRRLSITTVCRPDQIEKRLVFRNRQQLTLAEHPAGWREVAREHADLSDVWLCHRVSPYVADGKMPW